MEFLASSYVAQLINPALRSNLQSTSNDIGWTFLNDLAPNIVNIFFIAGAVVFTFMFLINSIAWILNGGDRARLEDSRKGIMNAVWGLLVLFAAYIIVRIFNELLGLNIGNIGGITNTVNVNPPTNGFQNLGNLTYQSFLTDGIRFVLVLGVVVFFFMFITGGIKWISSGGNKDGIESSRKTLTNAIVGLVIVFMVFASIYLLNAVFGTNVGGLGSGAGTCVCELGVVDSDADNCIPPNTAICISPDTCECQP